MAKFLELLRVGLQACGASDAPLLLAVSGGADSVALLRGCFALADPLGLTLRVAHLNHGLRGNDSDADAAWVAELCGRLKLPIQIGRPEHSLSEMTAGLEAAARSERYRFLAEAARSSGCSAVVTAHTADDQAETVLHHVIRGTALSGLRGIPARRVEADGLAVLRPMLGIRRVAVESWLAEIGQDCRTDATNADPRFTRNRLRHELIPLLARHYHPGVVESLLRLSEVAAEAEQTLELLAERLLDQAAAPESAPTPDTCRLDCARLTDAPRHLVRQVFVQLWRRRDWPRQAMSYDHWDLLARMTKTPFPEETARAATLPGRISVRRKRSHLLLERPAARTGIATVCDDPVQVSPFVVPPSGD